MLQQLRFHYWESPCNPDYRNLEFLYDKYSPMLYGIILKAVHNDTEQAAMVLQEVFIIINSSEIDDYNKNIFPELIRTAVRLLSVKGYDLGQTLKTLGIQHHQRVDISTVAI